MDERAVEIWAKLCGSNDIPVLLSTIPVDAENQAVLAARRILLLEELYTMSGGSQWTTLLVLLCECHFLLFDNQGARIMAEEAQKTLGEGTDQILDTCVTILRGLEQIDLNDEGGESEDPVIPYERPQAYIRSSQPSDLHKLQIRWATMQAENDGAEQFERLACVETNAIENVFDLEENSTMKLARCGFFANSIESISRQSRFKKKTEILGILENTQRSFNSIKQKCIDKNTVLSCFQKDFILELHALLMNETKVEFEQDGFPKYTPTGRYRHALGYTLAENADGTLTEVRYCPAKDIEEHMEWFLQEVREILSTPEQDLDPFRAAAWIQWAFVRIHPFSDGNGRMCRLLSSIPLIMNDLPPVFVSNASKPRYLEVLTKVDEEGDIDDLATFLKEEAYEALGNLLSENDVDVERAEWDWIRANTTATLSSSGPESSSA
ncbi:MAG: hypothetical protein SGARI_002378 [Bacillariaceae sp.]